MTATVALGISASDLLAASSEQFTLVMYAQSCRASVIRFRPRPIA